MRLAPSPERAIADAVAGRVAGLAVPTSGSTGQAREVLLDASALVASAHATHQALAGPGRWLLALPVDRIAGAMVWVRSLVAGTTPETMAPGPFTASAFARATARLVAAGGGPHYVSLVPTQVRRLLDSDEGRAALDAYDAVLVGGAPFATADPPASLVRTYGATETCGGCVYDGLPIGDTRMRVVEGRVQLSGSALARGYRDGDQAAWVEEGGTRWFITSDLGALGDDGRLTILGRADDAINTGGVKVHPVQVEAAMNEIAWVADVVVTSVPSQEWGEAVAALVVVEQEAGPASALDAVRETLASRLPREAVPRHVWPVTALPLLESGKIDRSAARRLATHHLDRERTLG